MARKQASPKLTGKKSISRPAATVDDPDDVAISGDGVHASGSSFLYPKLPAGADLGHIVLQLRPFAVAIESLNPDPANPRLHGDFNLKSIRDSLVQFGQDQPLVVQREGMVVRKGNGRLEAAKSLGWKYVAALVLDEETIKAVARGIADNRSGELAEWDYQTLAQLMRAMKDAGQDLTTLGWQPHEFETLLQAQWQPPQVEDSSGPTDPGSGEQTEMGKPLALTKEQRQTIDECIERLRRQVGNRDLSEGRCLELVCADWLSGAPLANEEERLARAEDGTEDSPDVYAQTVAGHRQTQQQGQHEEE